MSTQVAGRAPVTKTTPRLSDADRAFMQAVAEREWAQGKILFEEYQYIQDQCRVHLGAALLQRILRLAGGKGVARFPSGRPNDPVLSMLQPHGETIPVSSIVGSVDRAAQLDHRFRPLHGGRARLESIHRAMEAGVTFQPIEVYRIAGACYVRDGHHRVAAAKQVGQLYLDAMVSECWPQGVESDAPLETARLAFGLHTGLHAPTFTTPERYDQALRQIHDHQWYLGERGRIVSLAAAAQDWYHTTYLPVLQQMVAEGLAPLDCPSKAGDHYFEVCERKGTLRAAPGQDSGFAMASPPWASRLPRHPRIKLFRRRATAGVA
jgi:hypothetical protein